MKGSSATAVLETPELIELFSLYLTPPDLLSCIQVNSRWNLLFIPVLWRTINDKLYSWDKFLRKLQTPQKDKVDIFKLLEKYGQHIRHLTLRQYVLVKAANASTVCTNLRSLKIRLNMTEIVDPYKDIGVFDIDAYVSLLDQQDSDISDTDNDDNVDDDNDDDSDGGGGGGGEDSGSDGASKEIKGNGGAEEEGSNKIEEEEGGNQDELPEVIYPVFVGEFKAPRASSDQVYLGDEVEVLFFLGECHWSFIMANPRLRRLCLSTNVSVRWGVQCRDFFHKALSNLKELRQLGGHDFLDMSCLLNIHKLAPQVEKVTGVGFHKDDNDTPMTTNPAIKSLRVSGSVRTCMLLKVLDGLPNLEELAVNTFEEESDLNLISRVQTLLASSPLGFNLKLLDICSNRCGGDQLASLFELLPSLTKLRIENVSEKMVRALATRCWNLEIVEIGEGPWFLGSFGLSGRLLGPPEDSSVNQLFVSCPNLKVFNGIKCFINANELIQYPWACHRLEKFRCRIVGVERLNSDEQIIYDKMTSTPLPPRRSDNVERLSERESAAMQKVERSREQQRGVYNRLAGLKDLKCLDMGFENRNPWTYMSGNIYISRTDGKKYLPYDGPIHDTLELSLESGLHLLADLKDLEVFGFEAVNHRITEKELDWMAKSWPKLKLMYGLAKDRLYRIEYDKEKARLRNYMKYIKPDVRHGTLFRGRLKKELSPLA